MVATPRSRAVLNYRKRLSERGMARFEVQALDTDRDLIRALARLLAANDPESGQLRAALQQSLSGQPRKKGGILQALRSSPLVGADWTFERALATERQIDL